MRPVIAFAGLIAALFLLQHELAALSLGELRLAVAAIPAGRLAAAGVLTVLNYAVLTCFDQLAFATLGLRAKRWRVALASFLGYAVSNTVGFSVVSGSSVRYRYYSRWGLTAEQIAQVVVFYSGTFWLGVLVLGGVGLVARPAPGVTTLLPQPWVLALGASLCGMAVAYASLSPLRTGPVHIGSWTFPVPASRTVAAQFALSTLDWALAGAVLWVLLPEPRPPFLELLSAFIAAQLLGLVSHVPGGIGVFESLMVVLMTPTVTASDLLPALVAYRMIYYLLPFALAVAIVVADEARQSHVAIRRAGSMAGAFGASAAPRVLAAATFAAGAVLLFSGATPAVASRLSWLARVVPYPLLEISHFTGSVVGVVLLLLSQAISRRVDAAWGLSVVSLAVGIIASLFKGGDYEEALLLAGLMAALVTARSRFDRKAAVFDAPFSLAWFMAVLAVVTASLFLGAFAFKHVDYSHELWWRFALNADAPRFLRASVGAGVTVLVFGLRHLLMPARADIAMPSDDELEAADRVIGAQRSVYPNLVFLRDKSLLWNADRTAFLMFAVQGRTWVALHDPVGPRTAAADLVCEFLKQARGSNGTAVFYEVRPDFLQFYADVGLTLAKIGEEAIVPLRTFTLDGSARKALRTTLSRLTREGLSFRVLPASEVARRLDELQVVSDEWLSRKATAEKGFSLGFFDREYLSRFPVAVLEHDGTIEAFANVWAGASGDELSVDLMRYRNHVPACTTEGLLIHLLLWGRERGYSTFGLGMAPLAGIDATGIGPRWRRLARYVYRHGESFYNFQGVRAFKEKFAPDWESRYLAYPGGLTEARVLADVSALIAGGYRRIFFRAA